MSELKLIGNVRKRTLTIGVPVYECTGAVEISGWRAIAAFNKAAAGAVTDILTTKRVPGVGIHSDVDGLFLELCSPRRVEMSEIISSFLDGGSKFVFNRIQFTWDKLNKVSIDHQRGSVDIWQYIGQESVAIPSIYYAHRRKVFRRDGMLLAVSDLLSPDVGEEVFA